MSAPVRIQRRRTKGWRMPPNTVYVGRPTKWGNPFTLELARQAGYGLVGPEFLTESFREWLTLPAPQAWWWGKEADVRRAAILDHIGCLRGKTLACWCPIGSPCHADVLLEIANR